MDDLVICVCVVPLTAVRAYVRVYVRVLTAAILLCFVHRLGLSRTGTSPSTEE